MQSLTHMSLNVGFQMFPCVRKLQSRVMKNATKTAVKQCRAPRTDPDILAAVFLGTNASDTMFRQDSWTVSVFHRENLHNISRAALSKHFNTFFMYYRKHCQLTLSKATGSRVQGIQPPAPSVVKVLLSFPVLGYDHTSREENTTASTQSPSLSLRALPEQQTVSHMHTATSG